MYPTHLGREGKWNRILRAGFPWRFHFELGPLLLSAAVAVNWKCQTCRLTVASRVCVINRTSHGTPNERVVSIRTETDPTIRRSLEKKKKIKQAKKIKLYRQKFCHYWNQNERQMIDFLLASCDVFFFFSEPLNVGCRCTRRARVHKCNKM